MQGQQRGKSRGFEIVGRRQRYLFITNRGGSAQGRKDQGSAAANGTAKSRWFNETRRPTYMHVE